MKMINIQLSSALKYKHLRTFLNRRTKIGNWQFRGNA